MITPFLREWTMIFPSAARANRIPSGLSRVTRYSFRFILNAEELPDMAKTLRVPPLNRSLSVRINEEVGLREQRPLPQKEQVLLPSSNGGGNWEESMALVEAKCRVSILRRWRLRERRNLLNPSFHQILLSLNMMMMSREGVERSSEATGLG